jgi:hypothetical protein
MILFFQSLAQRAQMRFCFSRALRSVRKRNFVFQEPCAACANEFSFFKRLAQRAQTCFDFILPLRDVRKHFIFQFRLCALRASENPLHCLVARS